MTHALAVIGNHYVMQFTGGCCQIIIYGYFAVFFTIGEKSVMSRMSLVIYMMHNAKDF
jgi:hypothetical protein